MIHYVSITHDVKNMTSSWLFNTNQLNHFKSYTIHEYTTYVSITHDVKNLVIQY